MTELQTNFRQKAGACFGPRSGLNPSFEYANLTRYSRRASRSFRAASDFQVLSDPRSSMQSVDYLRMMSALSHPPVMILI